MIGNDKICLITGASSGIGYAIAQALDADGYKVIATARRLDKLSELGLDSDDLIAGDLNLPDFQDSIADIDIDKLTSMIRLNVESTFRLTYKILKRFKKQGFGHVLNISSVLGTKVRPTAGGYGKIYYEST